MSFSALVLSALGLSSDYDTGTPRQTTMDTRGRLRIDGGPVANYAAVTTHDSTDLPGGVCRGLYVGVSGDVVAVTPGGTAVTFKAAAVGYHPIMCKRVNATGTTATNIVALY